MTSISGIPENFLVELKNLRTELDEVKAQLRRAGSGDLGDEIIETVHIQSEAVIEAKIAPSAVSTNKIDSEAVTLTKVASETFPSLVQLVAGMGDYDVNIGPWVMGVSNDTQNDQIGWDLLLGQGTYNLTVSHNTGPTNGIYTVRVDTTIVGTIDGYDAGVAVVVDTLSGIIISGNTTVRVTFKMETKNPSSSSYLGSLNSIQLRRV